MQNPGQSFQTAKSLTAAVGDIRVSRPLGRSHALTDGEGGTTALPVEGMFPVALETRQSADSLTAARLAPGRTTAGPAERASQPVDLTYGPGQQTAPQTPAQPPSQTDSHRESDYVRNLPDWARRFLKESWPGHPGGQEMSVARNISTRQGGEETVQWTAPGYRPAPPMNHREKKQEKEKPPQQVQISEAEIQRTADRVYRILEDRIREERIRLGF